ncbi:MAG: hypothetical protein ACYDAL_16360 [Candidatus Dormibacteraceae bacterium]
MPIEDPSVEEKNMSEPEKKFEVEVSVRIQEDGNYSNGLGLSQRLVMPARNFMELCQVLGKFHELSERLKEGKFNVRIDG